MSDKIEFRYLNEPDMVAAGVTDIARCTDVMEEALILMRQGDYVMAGSNHNSHGAMITFPEEETFPGMPVDGPDRRFMAMPAYLGGRFGNAGVKWYGSNAENRKKGQPRSIHIFVLNDRDTGAPLAIMSANLLSSYRTGGVPGVGIKHLARSDAEVATIIGPGVMGRTILEAIVALRPSVRLVKVKGRSQAGTQGFVDYVHEKHPGLAVEVSDTIEEAVADSDIVVSATTTDATGSEGFPYIKASWIKPGALLLLPAAVRFDDDFITGPARTVLDAHGLYRAWEEEYGTEAYQILGIVGSHFYDLVSAGKMSPDKLEEIADIALGTAPGRRNDEEIILYSVGGMPIEDVAWATEIYGRAQEEGIGQVLTLWDEPMLS